MVLERVSLDKTSGKTFGMATGAEANLQAMTVRMALDELSREAMGGIRLYVGLAQESATVEPVLRSDRKRSCKRFGG